MGSRSGLPPTLTSRSRCSFRKLIRGDFRQTECCGRCWYFRTWHDICCWPPRLQRRPPRRSPFQRGSTVRNHTTTACRSAFCCQPTRKHGRSCSRTAMKSLRLCPRACSDSCPGRLCLHSNWDGVVPSKERTNFEISATNDPACWRITYAPDDTVGFGRSRLDDGQFCACPYRA